MKKLIKKFFKWVFKEEIDELIRNKNGWQFALNRCIEKEKKLDNILGNIEVSVDVHQYSPSWAVISIQGEKSDYIKFIDLGNSEIKEISQFLRKFDREKIDAYPSLYRFMKEEQNWLKFRK